MIHIVASLAHTAAAIADQGRNQGCMDCEPPAIGTFRTFAIYAGSIICLGCVAFAGLRLRSRRFQDATPAIMGLVWGVFFLVSGLWLPDNALSIFVGVGYGASVLFVIGLVAWKAFGLSRRLIQSLRRPAISFSKDTL